MATHACVENFCCSISCATQRTFLFGDRCRGPSIIHCPAVEAFSSCVSVTAIAVYIFCSSAGGCNLDREVQSYMTQEHQQRRWTARAPPSRAWRDTSSNVSGHYAVLGLRSASDGQMMVASSRLIQTKAASRDVPVDTEFGRPLPWDLADTIPFSPTTREKMTDVGDSSDHGQWNFKTRETCGSGQQSGRRSGGVGSWNIGATSLKFFYRKRLRTPAARPHAYHQRRANLASHPHVSPLTTMLAESEKNMARSVSRKYTGCFF